MWNSNEVS